MQHVNLARIAQFRYIKIQPKTIDLSTGLWGINYRVCEVYCFRLNFKISKLGYYSKSEPILLVLDLTAFSFIFVIYLRSHNFDDSYFEKFNSLDRSEKQTSQKIEVRKYSKIYSQN